MNPEEEKPKKRGRPKKLVRPSETRGPGGKGRGRPRKIIEGLPVEKMADSIEAVRMNDYTAKQRKHWTHEPDDKERRVVYSYAAYGAALDDIADALGMSLYTLNKVFGPELRAGRATAKNTIAQRLYQIAVGKEAMHDPETGKEIAPAVKPNLAALIFLAKVRLGWREVSVVENVEMKSAVQIYLPDNGMKPSKDEAYQVEQQIGTEEECNDD